MKTARQSSLILLGFFVGVCGTQLSISSAVVKAALGAGLALLILLTIAAHPRER